MIGAGVVVLGIVLLILLALPLLSVKGDSEAAQSELNAALDALGDGDLPTAQERVASAREHVDAAGADMNGIGGQVWAVDPVPGDAGR